MKDQGLYPIYILIKLKISSACYHSYTEKYSPQPLNLIRRVGEARRYFFDPCSFYSANEYYLPYQLLAECEKVCYGITRTQITES